MFRSNYRPNRRFSYISWILEVNKNAEHWIELEIYTAIFYIKLSIFIKILKQWIVSSYTSPMGINKLADVLLQCKYLCYIDIVSSSRWLQHYKIGKTRYNRKLYWKCSDFKTTSYFMKQFLKGVDAILNNYSLY